LGGKLEKRMGGGSRTPLIAVGEEPVTYIFPVWNGKREEVLEHLHLEEGLLRVDHVQVQVASLFLRKVVWRRTKRRVDVPYCIPVAVEFANMDDGLGRTDEWRFHELL
jgi:hypothetical protein